MKYQTEAFYAYELWEGPAIVSGGTCPPLCGTPGFFCKKVKPCSTFATRQSTIIQSTHSVSQTNTCKWTFQVENLWTWTAKFYALQPLRWRKIIFVVVAKCIRKLFQATWFIVTGCQERCRSSQCIQWRKNINATLIFLKFEMSHFNLTFCKISVNATQQI